MERTIRVVSPDDAAELLALYRPYVEETAISFEWETPTLEEFAARIRRTLTKYPYLVLEQAGELLGYAYLSPFHTRAAYAWGAETTIYLRRDSLGQGVGKALYTALEAVAKAQQHPLPLRLYRRAPGRGPLPHRQQPAVPRPPGLPPGRGVPNLRL